MSTTPNVYAFSHPGFFGRIGVARIDITPPVEIYGRRWGASEHDLNEGVHRPLTATVLTLQNEEGDMPLCLVAWDLSWMDRIDDERYFRHALLEELGCDESQVMFNFGHSHAVPATNREMVDKPGGDLIEPYMEKLRAGIVSAARQALSEAVPAVLEWTTGRCALATNRDLPDPDADRIICGFHPGEKADDTILVGRVGNAAGETLAVIVNYACHPTTLAWQNRLISPDFVGAMRETVEEQTPGSPCLFLQGASGELAPRRQYTGDTEIADRNGRQLGYAVLEALEGMLPPGYQLLYDGVMESGAPLAMHRSEPRTPGTESILLRAALHHVELDLKEFPSASELEKQMEDETDRAMLERLRRKLNLRHEIGDSKSIEMPLWIWQAGEAILVGQPYETYSHFQTELRRTFPGTSIVVMNLVNGCLGYLPPAELYDLDIYQVWQTPLAAGSLERVIKAATQYIALLL